LGPVPMPLARLDLHHVPHLDRSLLVFGSDIASARGHDQELVAIMGMPSGIASLTKMHHTTVVLGGVPGRNDGLPRPGHRSRPPRRLLGSAFHGKNRDIFECYDAHTAVSCCPACSRLRLSYPRTYCTTDPAHTEATHAVAASTAPVGERGKGRRACAATRVCVPVCAAGRRGPPGCPPLQRCALPALHLAAPTCPPAPQGMGQVVTLLPSRSRTSRLRLLLWDLSRAVCVVSSRQSSALETRFQPFFQASWLTSERTATASFHAHKAAPLLSYFLISLSVMGGVAGRSNSRGSLCSNSASVCSNWVSWSFNPT